MPEVLQDSVLYFDPYETASITQAMRTILQDAPLREALRAKGLANIQRFNWQTSASKVSDLLDSALASSSKATARAA